MTVDKTLFCYLNLHTNSVYIYILVICCYDQCSAGRHFATIITSFVNSHIKIRETQHDCVISKFML